MCHPTIGAERVESRERWAALEALMIVRADGKVVMVTFGSPKIVPTVTAPPATRSPR